MGKREQGKMDGGFYGLTKEKGRVVGCVCESEWEGAKDTEMDRESRKEGRE